MDAILAAGGTQKRGPGGRVRLLNRYVQALEAAYKREQAPEAGQGFQRAAGRFRGRSRWRWNGGTAMPASPPPRSSRCRRPEA